MKRSLHTITVIDSWRKGPFTLTRRFTPRGDPYEQNFNPYVDLTPYLRGLRLYSITFRTGLLRAEVQVGRS